MPAHSSATIAMATRLQCPQWLLAPPHIPSAHTNLFFPTIPSHRNSVQFQPHVAAACKRLTNLELVQTMSAGYDWLDMDVIPHGISVCNTSSMDHAIAEYVFSFHARAAFCDVRKPFEANAHLPHPHSLTRILSHTHAYTQPGM